MLIILTTVMVVIHNDHDGQDKRNNDHDEHKDDLTNIVMISCTRKETDMTSLSGWSHHLLTRFTIFTDYHHHHHHHLHHYLENEQTTKHDLTVPSHHEWSSNCEGGSAFHATSLCHRPHSSCLPPSLSTSRPSSSSLFTLQSSWEASS